MYGIVISNILTILYNYLHCLIRKFPSSPKRNPILVNSDSQVPSTHIPRKNSVSLQIYLFWTLHIDGITVCSPLCLASFTEHSVLRHIHAVACVGTSFLFMAELCFTEGIDRILFVCFGCLRLLLCSDCLASLLKPPSVTGAATSRRPFGSSAGFPKSRAQPSHPVDTRSPVFSSSSLPDFE